MLIVIEGTDCSGKETQSKLLESKLQKDGKKVKRLSFPMYDTPTGKIVGGSYLGKKYIGPCIFPEGAIKVDPFVASLYYAADRKYNIGIINKLLEEDYIVILDRYIESNMAHQGGKIKNKDERFAMYHWLESLEYDLLNLPHPDLTYLLYVPWQKIEELKKARSEAPDEHERDLHYLEQAELAYMELAQLYQFVVINCLDGDRLRTINDINEELYSQVKKLH